MISSGRADEQHEIGGHAHRHEEEAEQQTFERIHVGFELVPVFGVRHHHAGQERTEAHGEAERLHGER